MSRGERRIIRQMWDVEGVATQPRRAEAGMVAHQEWRHSKIHPVRIHDSPLGPAPTYPGLCTGDFITDIGSRMGELFPLLCVTLVVYLGHLNMD
jgi:hypothetical protein